MEPLVIREKPIPLTYQQVELEWKYVASDPLTDALWLGESELFCFQRRPGEADLVAFVDGRPTVLVSGIGHALQLGGRRESGLFLSSHKRLFRWNGGALDLVHQSDSSIVSFDVSVTGDVACVLGDVPGRWRAIVVPAGGGAPQPVDTKRVLRAVWCGRDLIVLYAERRQGLDTVGFTLWTQESPSRKLSATSLALRAEVISNGLDRVFVAGGVMGGGAGAWVFDPRDAPPWEPVSSVLPGGWPTFLGPETVAFGAAIGSGSGVVVANHSQVRCFAVDGPTPMEITAAPVGNRIAWAQPEGSGEGVLRVCRLAIEG